MLDCDDQYCSVHKDEIVDLYKSVVNACIIASDHIPTTSPSTAKVMPGWNDGVKYLRDEALSWHHFWKINSRPRAGYLEQDIIDQLGIFKGIRKSFNQKKWLVP